MNNDENVFSSLNTKQVKGLAIVLMFIHHLWAFPDRIPGGNLKYIFYFSYSSLGLFGKICVSIFFFLGGYGIYLQSTKKDFTILKNIKKLYVSYWKVFLIFIPIALLFFNNQINYCDSSNIYARFSNYSWNSVLENFLGFSNSLNGEWWFFKSYLIAIITFPLAKKIIEKNSIHKNIFYIVIFDILITTIFPQIGKIEGFGSLNKSYLYNNLFCQSAPFAACFYMGILFAKENLIIKLRDLVKKNYKINFITDIIIMFFIMYLRTYITGAELDILFVPLIIIVFIDLISYLHIISKLFESIGKHSTNMWLIHSFYCYYFYPVVKIVIKLKWAIPCLIVLIVLTYISSYFVNVFWKYVVKLYTKIHDLILNLTNKCLKQM